MPICHNCQCFTNDHIYPQWKPQGTTWCKKCLDIHKMKASICDNCKCFTNDHIYPQWKPQGTRWCLQCFEHKINPLPEGFTSIEENIIYTE